MHHFQIFRLCLKVPFVSRRPIWVCTKHNMVFQRILLFDFKFIQNMFTAYTKAHKYYAPLTFLDFKPENLQEDAQTFFLSRHQFFTDYLTYNLLEFEAIHSNVSLWPPETLEANSNHKYSLIYLVAYVREYITRSAVLFMRFTIYLGKKYLHLRENYIGVQLKNKWKNENVLNYWPISCNLKSWLNSDQDSVFIMVSGKRILKAQRAITATWIWP